MTGGYCRVERQERPSLNGPGAWRPICWCLGQGKAAEAIEALRDRDLLVHEYRIAPVEVREVLGAIMARELGREPTAGEVTHLQLTGWLASQGVVR